MLSMSDALRLLEYLLPHIPDDATDITVLEFGGKILDSIIRNQRQADYVYAISLMSGMSPEDVITLDVQVAFALFIRGLEEVELFTLLDFYDGLVNHG